MFNALARGEPPGLVTTKFGLK